MSEIEPRMRVETRAERTAKREREHQERAREAYASHLAWGGQRAREVQAQVVRGEWIFYWSPVIDQLKREGRLQEAYDLALECAELAETTITFEGVPVPGWTEKLAVVARKMGRVDLEVQALERWVAIHDANKSEAGPTPLHARLDKARALLRR